MYCPTLTVQLGELLALLEVLMEYQSELVIIFSDSQYVVQVICFLLFS